MNFKITAIRDAGTYDKERIVIEPKSEMEIGEYVLFRTKRNNKGEITTGVQNVMWFPDKKISAKDLVVVYTKNGTSSEKENKDGNKSHFFYWGEETPLWENEKEMALVILHVSEWSSYISFRKE